jgi:hypothetical protein
MTTGIVVSDQQARQQDRAKRIKDGIQNVEEFGKDVADAFAECDWVTAGQDTWDDYCQAEFGRSLPRLDRDAQRDLIGSLSDKGMSTRAIESATGISRSTVSRVVAVVPDETTDARVTGTGGKPYPRKRPSRKPKTIPDEVADEAKPAEPVRRIDDPRFQISREYRYWHAEMRRSKDMDDPAFQKYFELEIEENADAHVRSNSALNKVKADQKRSEAKRLRDEEARKPRGPRIVRLWSGAIPSGSRSTPPQSQSMSHSGRTCRSISALWRGCTD